MLAADMAMRLRKALGSSSDFPRHHESSRHSLNGFCFAHDHPGRESAIPECAIELGHAKPVRPVPERSWGQPRVGTQGSSVQPGPWRATSTSMR
jgi:hypothetical protein